MARPEGVELMVIPKAMNDWCWRDLTLIEVASASDVDECPVSEEKGLQSLAED